MTTTTAQDIITQSLKKAGILGVGQTALAEDFNDAFVDLNDMLAQWSRKRWLVYHLVDTPLTSTGAVSYTVGTGGSFNIIRPDRLEDGNYFRMLNTSAPNQVDYPLELLQSYEDYSRIGLKQLGTFPQYIFYDSGYPLGNIFVWPVPQASLYQIHILTKATLGQFTALTDPVNLPPEYNAAIKWNLSERLRASYRLPQDPGLMSLAKDSLAVIRGANVQVPRLEIPVALTGGGNYNVYSDRIT